MRKARRSDPTGSTLKGRHHFDEMFADCVRAAIHARCQQLHSSLLRLKELYRRRPEAALKGQIDYFDTAYSFLLGWLRGGTASVDELDWAAAWSHVTVHERAHGKNAPRPDQPTIPGM